MLARRIEYGRTHKKEATAGNRRRKYGVTAEIFERLLNAQNDVCWICHEAISWNTAHVDHDHKTQRVRGLLCRPCNQGLGHFRDRVDLLTSAAAYLQVAMELQEATLPN